MYALYCEIYESPDSEDQEGVIPDLPAYVFCGGYGQIRGVDEGMAESV